MSGTMPRVRRQVRQKRFGKLQKLQTVKDWEITVFTKFGRQAEKRLRSYRILKTPKNELQNGVLHYYSTESCA